MKDTVTISQFTDAMTRDGYGFSYKGSKALFEYLIDLEEDCSQELEFDPIAFRCDFNEYETLEECLDQYDDLNSLEELQDHTTVIEVPNSKAIIIRAF
tara:strand:- start:632 stop:925 length:294 start_codon:yes stop_codon:yes gene_type:complete